MISVCMATFNGENYLRQQISSILEQLSPDDELIISDDGSTDGTIAVIDSFADSRIKLVHNFQGHGVNSNFQNALSLASGEYIFLSDQDDVWLPGKVEKCITALQNADLVLHDANITDNSLNTQNKSLFSELHIKEGFVPNFIRNRFTGCCMAFRKEILSYVSPIPDNGKFLHDQWIGLLASVKGKVTFLDEAMILFRRHDANASSAGTKSSKSITDKLFSRLSLGLYLIKRIRKK